MDDKPDQLEVKTSLGSVRATGNLIVLLVVMLAGFVGIGYMIRDHDVRQATMMHDHDIHQAEITAAARTERMQQFNSMESNQRALKDSVDENTYVQTLTLAGKQALHMDMPASLWAKTHR